MKNTEVLIAFKHKERAKSSTGNLWSTGDCLYSYNTCIAEYDKRGILHINLDKYSKTTSHHQNLACKYLYDFSNKYKYNVERNSVHIVPKSERIY